MAGQNTQDTRVVPNTFVEADEGAYYYGVNPTLGTGIAMGVVTGFVATTPLLVMFNGSTTNTGTRLYLDYIRLICTAAGASSVSADLAVIVDQANATRVSSGGTALTIANAKGGYQSLNSKVVATFGAVTSTNAVNAANVTRIRLKTQTAPCWVVGDSVVIKFGQIDGQGSGLTSGTVTTNYAFSAGPVIAEPQSNILVYLWNASNAVTPPSFEVEVGWFER